MPKRLPPESLPENTPASMPNVPKEGGPLADRWPHESGCRLLVMSAIMGPRGRQHRGGLRDSSSEHHVAIPWEARSALTAHTVPKMLN